jgi:hypothetical protein
MVTLDSFQQELSKRAPTEGLATTDMLELSEPLRRLIQKIARESSMSLSTLAIELGLTLDEARQVGDLCVEKGLLLRREQEGEISYHVRFAPTGSLVRAQIGKRRPPKIDVWQVIDGS